MWMLPWAWYLKSRARWRGRLGCRPESLDVPRKSPQGAHMESEDDDSVRWDWMTTDNLEASGQLFHKQSTQWPTQGVKESAHSNGFAPRRCTVCVYVCENVSRDDHPA